MGIFHKLGFAGGITPTIDWQLIPAETFGIFESWGGRERIRSIKERFYYFFIDTWEEPPALCLMERGIKFARVLARIDAPRELIDQAIRNQGKTIGMDRSYAIDEALRKWLEENVIDTDDDSRVIPLLTLSAEEELATGLPGPEAGLPAGLSPVRLDSTPRVLQEKELPTLIRQGDFFDIRYNPRGRFTNFLVDNRDGLTVTDLRTGLMWQRGGCDITSSRGINNYINRMNASRLAGFSNWRLPTVAEALSLLEPVLNHKGLYLHPCFSAAQPFIFLAGRREPGGFWFCDFKQGTVYWASGTIPGGFGRLCRPA